MQSPYLIIVGGAGSGKDTVAGFLEKNHGYVAIAQADPMKRLAEYLFGFTEHQLWGPTSARNAEDARFKDIQGHGQHAWKDAREHLKGSFVKSWLIEIGLWNKGAELGVWFENLYEQCYRSNKTLTPRAALQTLGTEFGRTAGHQDLWSGIAIRSGEMLLRGGVTYNRSSGVVGGAATKDFPGFSNVVITDGRFRNEVLNILKIGGRAMKLVNPVDESAATEAAGVKGHVSEAEQKGIPPNWFKYQLVNDKNSGLVHLEKLVSHVGFDLAGGILT